MSLRHIAISMLLVSTLFFITSCGSDSCTDVDDDSGCDCNGDTEEHPRASIEGLIEYFAESMEARDIDAYGECLTQGYLFRFAPEDLDSAGLPPEAPWWVKTQDLNSTGNMFSDADVSRIDVGLPTEDGGYVDGVYTVRCDPSIKVTVERAGGGDPTTYWVFSSWLYFEVGPDETESGLLQIVGIREQTKYSVAAGNLAATEPTTFGSIKAMYK